MRGTPLNYPPRRWAYGGGPLVRLKTRSFRRFNKSMDRQLAQLVERWAHAAAPNAVRPRRPLLLESKAKPK